MLVYKYKHLPTELFYHPVHGGHGTKSNLSVDGKLSEWKLTMYELVEVDDV